MENNYQNRQNLEAELKNTQSPLNKIVLSKHCEGRGALIIDYDEQTGYKRAQCGCGKEYEHN